MSFLQHNLKFLRKQKELTQAELAKKIGVTRAVIGTYEEGKAEPKLNTLRLLAKFFNTNLHALVEEKMDEQIKVQTDISGKNLRILPLSLNAETNKENISLVPHKASAGYLNGYTDPDFIENLPQFNLPFAELSKSRSYRVFQTKGNSMLPIENGAYIIAEYLVDWTEITDHQCYIVATKNEGLVYKRLINKLQSVGELILISDNKDYKPYTITAEEILEVWHAKGFISFALPQQNQQFFNLQAINDTLEEIKRDIKTLKTQ